MTKWMTAGLLVASLLLAAGGWAQEEELADQTQAWNEFYSERAADYQAVVDDGGGIELQLRPEPLLTYTNPVRRRDQHGALYVWLRDGRPQMIGSLWSIANLDNRAIRRTAHEVHSLADAPLRVECGQVEEPSATRARALAWTLEPLANSDRFSADWSRPPAPSAPRRLVQMRRIAGELAAVSIDRADGSPRALRLMSTPLLRYESKEAGVIDGCLFAYVLATDPEIVIAVEALDKPDGDPASRWRVTPARITGTELRLTRGKEQVWRCDKIDYQNQSGPYRLQIGVTELPATRNKEPAKD